MSDNLAYTTVAGRLDETVGATPDNSLKNIVILWVSATIKAVAGHFGHGLTLGILEYKTWPSRGVRQQEAGCDSLMGVFG